MPTSNVYQLTHCKTENIQNTWFDVKIFLSFKIVLKDKVFKDFVDFGSWK